MLPEPCDRGIVVGTIGTGNPLVSCISLSFLTQDLSS